MRLLNGKNNGHSAFLIIGSAVFLYVASLSAYHRPIQHSPWLFALLNDFFKRYGMLIFTSYLMASNAFLLMQQPCSGKRLLVFVASPVLAVLYWMVMTKGTGKTFAIGWVAMRSRGGVIGWISGSYGHCIVPQQNDKYKAIELIADRAMSNRQEGWCKGNEEEGECLLLNEDLTTESNESTESTASDKPTDFRTSIASNASTAETRTTVPLQISEYDQRHPMDTIDHRVHDNYPVHTE